MGGVRVLQQLEARGGQSQIQFCAEGLVRQRAPSELIFALYVAVRQQTRDQGLNFGIH
jgi:hypothetical protein